MNRLNLTAAVIATVIPLAGCTHPAAAPAVQQGPPITALDTAVHAAEPTGLDVPAIGVHITDIVKLGLDDNDELQIPDDATVTGWYPEPRPR